MTDAEAHLHLALAAVRKQAQKAEGRETKFERRILGAAQLCAYAAADLVDQAASLKEVRALVRARRR